MAEPESILQLGIEAARDGNKEEARNLFRLLTRQEPDNAQAWLWLAGVAENREERQAALEQVLALEPDNEMALKGLQALGVRPPVGGFVAPPPIDPGPPQSVQPPPRQVDNDPFDDDPFAELDNLSDVMASDSSGPVRRGEQQQAERDAELAAAAAAGSAAGAAAGGAAARRDRYDDTSRSTTRVSRYDDDEETTVPARRGSSPLLPILAGLVALGLIGLLLVFFFGDRLPFGGGQVADNGAEQTAAAQAATAGTGEPIIGGAGSEGTAPTVDPAAPTVDPAAPTVDPAAPAVDPAAPAVDPAAPTAEGTVAGEGATGGEGTAPDPAAANPAIVPANTPLSSEGWLYDFNQPTYAAPIVGNLGQFAPNNGRFVVVLAFVVNTTGGAQSLPAEFFVLKDAQGRVWQARPEVSEAYVIPGVNADLSMTSQVPADGLTRSMAVIFDVAPDATNLVFFARSNPGQGWLVLQAV